MAQAHVTRLGRELRVFLEEYLSITNNSAQLLRFDFFPEGSPKKPKSWHLGVLVAQEEKHYLINAQGTRLACYDQIVPLFCLSQDPKTLALVEDLQDQLLCLRSKAPQEQLLALTHSLQTLCAPFRSLSAAYLVQEQGLWGAIDPVGRVIVPVRYRCINPFPLREKFGTPGDCSSPAPGGRYGETGLYLCRGDLHQLNSTDVYDLNGNLIFQGIADLYPREEIWTTPPRITESTAPLLTREKQVRSIWVSQQQVQQPFPGAPELQSILDHCTHFSVRSLSRPPEGLRQHSLDNCIPRFWDSGSTLADRAFKHRPQAFHGLLMPLAAVIGAHIGISAEAVLDRLGDYSDFYRQRTGLSAEGLPPETPLQALGLTAQAYNCLVRNGITTAGDILALDENRIPRLWRSTPKVIEEIRYLQAQLRRHLL